MIVDASRSCLGLGTCVGSATRQIVVARVLLTATAPPALPSGSVSEGSLAPPSNVITYYLRSGCRDRHLPGDGPDEAGELAGDRGSDNVGGLAGPGELAIASAPSSAAIRRADASGVPAADPNTSVTATQLRRATSIG